MKPGKGNRLSSATLDSPTVSLEHEFERQRSRTLSINGELCEGIDLNKPKVDLSAVNIHDYAMFEKEDNLIPEFKASIKNKRETSASEAPLQRQRSFKVVAKRVIQMEKVLLKWPKRRPRSRHHSSSSEDSSTEIACEDGGVEGQGKSPSHSVRTETLSISNSENTVDITNKTEANNNKNKNNNLLKTSDVKLELNSPDESMVITTGIARDPSNLKPSFQTNCGEASVESGVVIVDGGVVHGDPLPSTAPAVGKSDTEAMGGQHTKCCSPCVVL